MELIDWAGVARNALWILGLSIVLATWSYSSWSARERGIRLREALGRPSFVLPSSAGMVLFSASLAWDAGRVWERALWIVLACGFAWQAVAAAREARQHGETANNG